MVNFGPLAAKIDWWVMGHLSKFQWVLRLGCVTAATSLNGSQPYFARCLAVFWAGTLYAHFWGLFSPNGIFPGAKFTLRPSFAFSYFGSITARHWSSGRQTNLTAWHKEWNYRTSAPRHFQQRAPRASITLSIGPHSTLLRIWRYFRVVFFLILYRLSGAKVNAFNCQFIVTSDNWNTIQLSCRAYVKSLNFLLKGSTSLFYRN